MYILILHLNLGLQLIIDIIPHSKPMKKVCSTAILFIIQAIEMAFIGYSHSSINVIPNNY